MAEHRCFGQRFVFFNKSAFPCTLHFCGILTWLLLDLGIRGHYLNIEPEEVAHLIERRLQHFQ